MATESLSDALQETLAVFDSAEPRTTTEIADRLALGRRSTYSRLERLADQNQLKTKKVGAKGRVWWRSGTEQEYSNRSRCKVIEQFESLVMAVEEYAIFMLSPDGIIQTWNPGAQRINGYDTDEILGEHFSVFYTDDDVTAGVPDQNLAEAATHGSIRDEGWRVRSDGSKYWAHVTISAIRDAAGDLAGYAKVIRDMTTQREHLETVRQRRDFTQSILETAPVGVLTVEKDGTFSVANHRAAELLELEDATNEPHTIGIKDVYDEDGTFLPPDERPYVRAFETGKSFRNWYAQLGLSNGSRRWLSSNIEPIFDEYGEVERVLVTVEDISQLKAQAEHLERERNDLQSELEEIFVRIDDAFIALDEDWRVFYANDLALDMVQLPAEELIGASVWDALYELADGLPREKAAYAMKTQESVEFEFYSELLNIWVEIRGYPSETGMSVYFRDITERKERERDLIESVSRYRTLVENFPNGAVGLFDDEFRYTAAGGELFDQLDLTPKEAVGATIYDLYPNDLVTRIEPYFTAALDGEVNTFEVEYHEKILKASTLPVGDDEVFSGMIVAQDITEQKVYETELERYETIVSTIRDGVYVLDEDYCFSLVNDAYVDMTGYDREQLIGTHCSLVVDESVSEKSATLLDKIVTEGERNSATIEADVLRADGSRLRAESNFTALSFADDGPIEKVGVVRDVSERAAREAQLAQQREQLLATNNLYEVVREITNAVINQSTREEIETTVCKQLSASESYLFAWIGKVETNAQTINPRIEAEVIEGLDSRIDSVDLIDDRGSGPTILAVQTGKIQPIQNILYDPEHEPLQNVARQLGFGSFVSVPIVHEDIVYGVLNVYTARPHAFEGPESDLMEHLGEIIGHATAAAERKRALMSDELVELEFSITDIFGVFDSSVESVGTISFDNAVPIADDKFLLYGTATQDAMNTVSSLVETIPSWEKVTVRSSGPPTHFELRLSESPLLASIASLGGYVDSAIYEDGDLQMTIHFAPSVDVRRVIDAVKAGTPQADLVRRQQITRPRDDIRRIQRRVVGDLTDRQRAALDIAYHAGFFEWPRGTTGKEIAESMGVAPPTFHQHLRKAEKKVFDELFVPTMHSVA